MSSMENSNSTPRRYRDTVKAEMLHFKFKSKNSVRTSESDSVDEGSLESQSTGSGCESDSALPDCYLQQSLRKWYDDDDDDGQQDYVFGKSTFGFIYLLGNFKL